MKNFYRVRKSNTSSRLYSVIIQSESNLEEEKEKEKRITYNNVFKRVFIEAQVEPYRIKEKKRAKITRLKKVAIETRKINAVEKKKTA